MFKAKWLLSEESQLDTVNRTQLQAFPEHFLPPFRLRSVGLQIKFYSLRTVMTVDQSSSKPNPDHGGKMSKDGRGGYFQL